MEESPRMKFISEEDNFTLLVYEVKPDDAGNYACVAINTIGKATCTAKLDVEGMVLVKYFLLPHEPVLVNFDLKISSATSFANELSMRYIEKAFT